MSHHETAILCFIVKARLIEINVLMIRMYQEKILLMQMKIILMYEINTK